jgi:hypothetical protein
VRLQLTIAVAWSLGCAANPLPPGTYEVYRGDQPSAQGSPAAEIVVTNYPLRVWLRFPSETTRYAGHVSRRPNTCVVERFVDDVHGVTTNLSLARPEAQEGGWKIRLLETHHFWSWYSLKVVGSSLEGTAHQEGWGGPHSTPLTITRVSDPNLARCLQGAAEMLAQ